MTLTSSPQVKDLLARHGIHAKKRLGQNFLIDRNVLDRLLEAAQLGPDSNVLEIGPGLGVVTEEAAKRAGRVVCVEIDRDLQPILTELLSDLPNAEIVIGDFLKLDLPEFLSERGVGRWTVIANLPYYITTPIMTKLIDSKQHFSTILLMVQREVGLRLRASAGSEEYGAIGVYVQYHCGIEPVMRVSRNVFYPIPDVDSELVKLTVREVPAVAVSDEAIFFSIVRAAFGKRRKTLLNALSSSSDLKWDKQRAQQVLVAAGIDPGRRGETLSLGEFASLANSAI
jgi:16S rRNA (adenine1518-N6/adenine1519-N6)-dimethyltransferase